MELGSAMRGNSGGTRWADVKQIVCHNLDRCCDQSRCYLCFMKSQHQPHEVEPPPAANGLELAELRPALRRSAPDLQDQLARSLPQLRSACSRSRRKSAPATALQCWGGSNPTVRAGAKRNLVLVLAELRRRYDAVRPTVRTNWRKPSTVEIRVLAIEPQICARVCSQVLATCRSSGTRGCGAKNQGR